MIREEKIKVLYDYCKESREKSCLYECIFGDKDPNEICSDDLENATDERLDELIKIVKKELGGLPTTPKQEKEVIDNVNNPKHYSGNCSFDCIDMMKLLFGKEAVMIYCLVNSFKYMWRFKNKNGKEDLQKVNWYLNHYAKEAKTLQNDPHSKEYHKLKALFLDILRDNNITL